MSNESPAQNDKRRDRTAKQREKMAELRSALREKTAFALAMQRRVIQNALAHGFDPEDDTMRELMPIETYPRPGAAGTTVAFAGLLIGFGMPQKEFFGTLRETEQSLVFVKDFEQMWYQRGLLGMCDTRSGAAAVLLDQLRDLPRPWTFIGGSAGGYAALFYGALLGADRMVAFAPQSLVDFRAFYKYTKSRPKVMGFDTDDPENDLVPLLERHPLRGQAFVHYGTQNDFDTAQADRLRAVPGIEFVGHDMTKHSIARELRNRGTLLDALYDPAPAGER